MTDDERRVLAALRDDFAFYAEHMLFVVDNQKRVKFQLRPAQLRFWRVLERQRAEGKPMRALVLKARKLGFSTMMQGLLIQRATQRSDHVAMTVALDTKTAYELFGIGELMYRALPDDPELAFLKPAISHQRTSREMRFGGAARNQQEFLNSRLLADTAREFEAGRGFTTHSLHLSEIAFWPDIQRKLTALLNTVPQDDPDTLVVLESTANGYNHFRSLWVQAESGENDYYPMFSPWFEDTRYRRRFISDEELEVFKAGVGDGAWGEDEPHLLELIPEQLAVFAAETGLPLTDDMDLRVLEHLNWRRWAIENIAQGDLQTFHQEYPATPDEAFISTGRSVFSPYLTKKVRTFCDVTDPLAERLLLETEDTVRRQLTHLTIDVPTKVRVREAQSRREQPWKVWQRPLPDRHYVIAIDPASGEENTTGDSDYSAIQVIDHLSKVQVAEWRSHADPDEVALQAFLIGLWFSVRPNVPLMTVEMNGGHGNSIANRVKREFGYKNFYRRRPAAPQIHQARESDVLGFSTDRSTKPALEAGMREILKQDDPGVRSVELAKELQTYIRTRAGKTGAEPDAHDDLLMAFMIAQFVAHEKPPKNRSAGGVVSTSAHRRRVVA